MKNPNFCVLPFFSFENSQAGNAAQNIYCCRLPAGTDVERLRQEIVQGQRSTSCSTCWKLEDRGLTSERQLHNSALDFYWDRDIELIEQDAIEGKYFTRMVKLATSNICNGTCVTCGPDLSSAWARLRNKPNRYRSLSMSDLDHIPWKEIQSLGFVGGEPLLEQTNFEILENLLSLGNHKCFIHLVTNGSVDITAHQLKVLSQFPNLNICFSIDGVDRRFEYLRYPLKWPRLLHNLDQLQSITENISVSCMISNLNVIYLDETLDWFRARSIKYLAKQIDHPHYFSPGNLPQSIKQDLLTHTRYPKEMSAFLACGSYTEYSWTQFCQEITYQDRLKKISIRDYLPQMPITKSV